MQPSDFFSTEQKDQILDAIRQAELNTSGEIRIHLDKHCKGDVMDRAAYLFEKLGMHKTNLRNGVLFYLAIDDHTFAILGDAGINAVVGDDYWDNIKDVMAERFREGDFAGGLSRAIMMAGEQLKQHFPYSPDDVNELPDEISFGESSKKS
ncbi:MAG: hypothetical protein AMS27_11795 [Bacteroides sp. SM23_62_1]|nr:MAG: hypothetical protein AMS27_11795 [Bacteroides sp. SM23_62_1]